VGDAFAHGVDARVEGLHGVGDLHTALARQPGAVMVGDAQDAAWYQELIASGSDVAAMRGQLMFGRALAQAA
jgi:hypothetical protein